MHEVLTIRFDGVALLKFLQCSSSTLKLAPTQLLWALARLALWCWSGDQDQVQKNSVNNNIDIIYQHCEV